MAKRRIEFLNSCTGWGEGYVTTIEMEDNAFYYFNNEWGQWTIIEKDKECKDFLIYEPNKRKPRKSQEPSFLCGGKDTTFKRLKERVSELKHNR